MSLEDLGDVPIGGIGAGAGVGANPPSPGPRHGGGAGGWAVRAEAPPRSRGKLIERPRAVCLELAALVDLLVQGIELRHRPREEVAALGVREEAARVPGHGCLLTHPGDSYWRCALVGS